MILISNIEVKSVALQEIQNIFTISNVKELNENENSPMHDLDPDFQFYRDHASNNIYCFHASTIMKIHLMHVLKI